MTEPRGLRFDDVAEDYDRARPTYPAALLDEAFALGDLRPGSRVLEVGCGTGKLARDLVARGVVLDAVDPAARMVDVARRSVPADAITFHVGRFEDVELPADAFDAVFSATAFHWIDPAVGWEKAARLLRPGGMLSLITYLPAGDAVDREFQAAWREVGPEAWNWELLDGEAMLRGAEDRRENVSDVWAWLTHHDLARPEAAALFDDVRTTTVPVRDEQTAESMVALIRTTSSYLGLDGASREALEQRMTAVVERAGGTVRLSNHAALVTARAAR